MHHINSPVDEILRTYVARVRSLAGVRPQVDGQHALAVERFATVRTHVVSRLSVDVHVPLQRMPEMEERFYI